MTGPSWPCSAAPSVHLQPGQVAHRARLRTQRAALRPVARPGRRLLAGPGRRTAPAGPPGSCPLDAGCPGSGPSRRACAAGQLELLGLRREPRVTAARSGSHAGAPAAVAVPPALLGLGLGAGRATRTGPRPRPLFARLWHSWQAAPRVRPRRRVAALPRGAAGLVLVRAARGTSWPAAPSTPGSAARSPRHAGLPAAPPRVRCRREPPDQGPQGAGRAGGVPRRRAHCSPGRFSG